MILVRLMGGLGNQMFQYAFGKFLSVRNNTTLKLDTTLLDSRIDVGVKRDYALSIFTINPEFANSTEVKRFNGIPNGNIVERGVYKVYRLFCPVNLVVQKGNSFEQNLLYIKTNTCVVGRWQSYKYFKQIADIIKEEFRFKNLLPQSLASLIREIHLLNSVSIHIRRTDYVSHAVFANAIGPLPMDYYLKAFNKVESVVASPAYFVFSDDIEWSIANLSFLPEHCIYVDTSQYSNSAEIDLHLMSLCKHHIISNSTFAWWGAWLNKTEDGVVIAPSKWANSPDYDPVDIIPEHWIKI